MKRREFSKAALAAVTVGTHSINKAESLGAVGAVFGPIVAASKPSPSLSTSVAIVGKLMLGGTNLSGMEWAKPGLRYGMSSAPNIHFTVPRAEDVTYLAASGFSKNRLPIQWELLQPMLHDTPANAASIAAIGRPGAFHIGYESYITGVLDAHAAVGTKCIIDNHNYCRYQDFKFQPNGSVSGLVVPTDALLRPYTTDNTQVRTRIFSLAEGATLTQANFNDFWARAAIKWRNHPGFGGYGLMNEPHDMPAVGAITGVYDAPPHRGQEDLTIWPTYAQAAINTIRAIDPVNPIYVAGNVWSSAMALATKNPGYPLKGENLTYEVHLYLDAVNNGASFDYDIERAKNFRAGIGVGPITATTGLERLKMAADWAKAQGVKLALTDVTILVGRLCLSPPPITPQAPVARFTAGWVATIGRSTTMRSTTFQAGTKIKPLSPWCQDNSRRLLVFLRPVFSMTVQVMQWRGNLSRSRSTPVERWTDLSGSP